MFTRRLLMLIAAMAILGGCAGPGQSVPASGAASVAPTPSSPASPGPTTSAGPTASVATSSPTASPSDSLGGLTCAFPVNRSGTTAGSRQARPTDVRVAEHPGYDRIVFAYSGTTRPAIRIERAVPPFKHDPSDLPLAVKGDSFLRIRLTGVASVYGGPVDFVVALPRIAELVQQGDFEAVQTWIVGLHGTACVRILELTAPERLVVDVAS